MSYRELLSLCPWDPHRQEAHSPLPGATRAGLPRGLLAIVLHQGNGSVTPGPPLRGTTEAASTSSRNDCTGSSPSTSALIHLPADDASWEVDGDAANVTDTMAFLAPGSA